MDDTVESNFLKKKAGFATEGLLRDAVQVDGVRENIVLMATLV